MRKPGTERGAEALGRTRLSRHFFMREFLYSEIANINGFTNLPDEPDLAIAVGRELCEQLLEPLNATFGRIGVRSGYRSPEVNAFGNAHQLSCASNDNDSARHIWDRRDRDGMAGAMVTVVIPWLLDRMQSPQDWTSMAWWIHDHLPYSELQFFPKLSAFNIAWREQPLRRIHSWVEPRGVLTKSEPFDPNHPNRGRYAGYPQCQSVERIFAVSRLLKLREFV